MSARLAIVVCVLAAGVDIAAGGVIQASDPAVDRWTAQVGGFHYLMDIQVMPRTGEMWGAGSGIARGDALGRWATTDWVPGYQLTGIAMTQSGDGWVVGTPLQKALDDPSFTFEPIIGRVHAGVVVERLVLPDVWVWRDIAAVSANDVWAVGRSADKSAPLMYHFDGQQWTDLSPSTVVGHPDGQRTGILQKVEMVRSDLGYALDAEGPVWRWDGKQWAVWTDSGIRQVYGFDVVNDDEIWVVGGEFLQALIAHFVGSEWVTVMNERGYLPQEIAMVRPDDGYAVGESGIVYHYDGDTWTPVQLTRPYNIGSLATLWTVIADPDRGRAIAAGMDGQVLDLRGENVTFLHPSTRRWFSAATADNSGGLWIGGGHCQPPVCRDLGGALYPRVPIILHYDQGTMDEEELPSHAGSVTGLATDAHGQTWAVGGEVLLDPVTRPQGAFILRRRSQAWESVATPTDIPLLAVAFTEEGTGWAIGYNGLQGNQRQSVVLWREDDQWQVHHTLPVGVELKALSAPSDSQVWVAGKNHDDNRAYMWHWSGTAWGERRYPGRSVLALDVLSADVGWAALDADPRSTLYRLRGDTWEYVQDSPSPGPIHALRVFSEDEAYGGTGQGHILHWNGSSWEEDFAVADPLAGFLKFGAFEQLEWDERQYVAGVGSIDTVMVRGDLPRLLPLAQAFLPVLVEQ